MPPKPPEFTLAQLDELLAGKCAEDDASLARRGIVLDDAAELGALYARQTEIRSACEEPGPASLGLIFR